MPLLGILSRSTRAEETKGAILRIIILVDVIIAHRLFLVKLSVILKKKLRLNFTNIKAFSKIL